MIEKKSNAQRFIEAYNTIDQELRYQHNFRRSMGFSDMIRKAVVVNFIVRRYEDDLIDFGRLRNAIIHKSNEEFIIAEPHLDVVEKMEMIAKLITAPPEAFKTICANKGNVVYVGHNLPVGKVIETIHTSSFSNLPVYENGQLIGIANAHKLLDVIGAQIFNGENVEKFFNETPIGSIVKGFDQSYFAVAPQNLSIEKALSMFFENRKLLVILLTKTGMRNELPVGILTPSDVMDMNKVIDCY